MFRIQPPGLSFAVSKLSTSVLPSGGGANPTMTLLLLAMRLVDRHAGTPKPAD